VLAVSTSTTTERRRVPLVALWRPPAISITSALRVWQRNATLFRRGWKRFVLPNFLEPVLYLFAIGLGLGLYVGEQIGGIPYIDYIAPGLAASSAMYGAVFELTFNVFVKLRFHKIYDAAITTPVEPEDVALGELLWGVTRSLLYGAAFLAVVIALGHAHTPWAALAPLALPLVGLAMGLIALLVTSRIPGIDLYTYFFNLVIVPLFLFSGIFFPIEQLPGWAQALAWLTPLHHGVELSRALVLTGDLASAGRHALWLVTFSALLFAPTINLMARRIVADDIDGAAGG
jgi:lipooligosaccharide transport system permease protein